MLKGIDRHHQCLKFKYFCSSGPFFNVFISILNFLLHRTHQIRRISIANNLIPNILANQLLHKKCGVKETAILEVRRKKNKTKHLKIVSDNRIVQVSVRLQLIHILLSDRKRLRFVLRLVSQRKLLLDYSALKILRIVSLVDFLPSLCYRILLTDTMPLE